MKKLILIPTMFVSFALADEKTEKAHAHDHDHSEHAHDVKIKAPNGGRILKGIVPAAEFFITKDRKIQITFVNDKGEAIKGGATLRAMGGERAAPTRFTFEKTEKGLLSKEKFPGGMNVPILLMFKGADGKKIPTIKFNVDFNQCPTCDFLEYACTCDHDGAKDDHAGHDHAGHDHAKKK